MAATVAAAVTPLGMVLRGHHPVAVFVEIVVDVFPHGDWLIKIVGVVHLSFFVDLVLMPAKL